MRKIQKIIGGNTEFNVYLSERNIYGSSRLGQEHVNMALTQAAPFNYSGMLDNAYGDKRYELSNHLGNVLQVITDRKLPENDGTNHVAHYLADVVSYSDYFPYGMQMPGRNGNDGDGYRYGFNGYEGDPELKGTGNSYTTEFRQYDPRIGRWLSLDPKAHKYPWLSPYAAFNNNPIGYNDPKGDEPPPGLVHINYRGVKTILNPFDYRKNKESGSPVQYNDKLFYAYGNSEFIKVAGYQDVVSIVLAGQIQYFNILFMPKITRDANGNEMVHPKEKEGNYVLVPVEPEKQYAAYAGIIYFRSDSYNFDTGVSTPVRVEAQDQQSYADMHIRNIIRDVDNRIREDISGSEKVDKNSVKVTDINIFFNSTTTPEYREDLSNKLVKKYPGAKINSEISNNGSDQKAFNIFVSYEFEKMTKK